jgi:hypothetical protein
MRSDGRLFLLLVSLSGLWSTSSLAAQMANNGFEVQAGYMKANSSTTLEFSGPVTNGKIDIEDVLDVDDSTDTARVGFAWRFKNKHKLSLELYQLKRDGKNTAETDFDFTTDDGDFVEISGGAGLKSTLDFEIIDLSYGYSFINTDKHHLIATVGLYWMDIDFELNGTAGGTIKVNGEELDPGQVDFSSRSTIGAPMPLLGGRYSYAINPNWTAAVDLRYFSVTIDPYSGSISNYDVSTRYNFNKFYVGGGYTWVKLDVDVDDDWKGSIDWQFDGPRLFIGARF